MSKENLIILLKYLLPSLDKENSFEIFFLAPIPILIIASFKRIIVKMFPLNIKMHPFETKDMISEEIAKKTFISSLIGVTSTFLLGKFIEIISLVPEESSYSNFTLSYDYVYLLILALVFLLLQIFLYLILSKSHKE